MSFDVTALLAERDSLRKRVEELEASTIRIASSPPTEEGGYWHRWHSSDNWYPYLVMLKNGRLCTVNLLGQREPVSEYSGQWSTRIPDPEEME